MTRGKVIGGYRNKGGEKRKIKPDGRERRAREKGIRSGGEGKDAASHTDRKRRNR